MLHSAIKVATYKNPIYAALSAVLLLSTASCVSTAPSATQIGTMNTADYCQSQTLTPSYKNQTTQQRAMSCMLAELQHYQQTKMTAHQQYFAYKAQAWLNYAINKDSMNSRSPAGLEAAQSAETILQALKNGTEQDLTLIEDIPKTSALMRPDLWANLSALKDSGGIVSAPREIAFSEVALIWAATDQCEHSSRQAGSHFRMADRWLEQAREAFVNAHDSKMNVALQDLVVRYYEQYATLDSSGDRCNGQVLPSLDQM
ncbi:hypothetical protein [Psychrobacter sp. DAB_AL62B]|uniref:hypothetical protein n=1 Tax=Psychrobacter sp. DAB_AL62B TaxID=1028420 RepID=UPI0023814F4A|nr:hypothetical protein [Psychrobacter sp. DAB_AL62B]MDE4453690.1 hypothetical protein [Psychrobacter sp. DAB_AL62B]